MNVHAIFSDITSTSTASYISAYTADELYFFLPVLPAPKVIGIPSRIEKIGLGPLRLFLCLNEIKIKGTTVLSGFSILTIFMPLKFSLKWSSVL